MKIPEIQEAFVKESVGAEMDAGDSSPVSWTYSIACVSSALRPQALPSHLHEPYLSICTPPQKPSLSLLPSIKMCTPGEEVLQKFLYHHGELVKLLRY